MSDLFDSYKKSLNHLLEMVGKDHPDYNKALAQRNRLIENIENSELHGDDPTSKAERNVILLNLDKIALRATGKSFHELYGLNREPSTNKPSSNMQQPVELNHVQRPKHINSAENKPENTPKTNKSTPATTLDYRRMIATIEHTIDMTPPTRFTGDYIDQLANQTSNVIIWLRSPKANTEEFKRGKDAVLEYLRKARTKFSLAVEAYNRKGLTEQFFKNIEEGRKYLEIALYYW